MSPVPRPQAPNAKLIETEIGRSRPADTPGGWQTLPEDLLRQASRRLGIVCLIIAGLWAANFLLSYLLQPKPPVMPDSAILRMFERLAAINIVASLGLFWYIRRAERKPRLLLNLGLGYELLIALSIGVLDWHLTPPAGTSWIAIIILIFSAIIPSPPRKTLVTAFLAASMDPVGALIWKATGQQVPGWLEVFVYAFPNYLCAAIAPLISHVIIGLAREVRKAREMGSYVLGERLGGGGMGEVWQATHRFLARPAAIKLIRPEVLEAATKTHAGVLIERFRREARAAANLRSPHTIQLYDFGVTSDGTFYYVMELLNGMDLQTLVEHHGALQPSRAVHILQQACESLGEAHDRGLVHRDIKPANIQVCCMGDYFDFVKVLDFGLVKTQAPTEDLRLTGPNVVAGTPAYLSPETALGEPVDRRADIYALGCVAYWMLTGRYVFEVQGALQMVSRHIHTPPEPPSRYSAFMVPHDLEQVVLACLAKRPSDRPQSTRELSDRLGQCDLESPWTREDARRWWETRSTPEPAVALTD
jgi:eukaryotic-like serine/threonine-protein kinase